MAYAEKEMMTWRGVDLLTSSMQQEAGVPRATPRRRWQPTVLRRVVGELMRSLWAFSLTIT